jgi:DNA-binding PadR family transcriptional regulator
MSSRPDHSKDDLSYVQYDFVCPTPEKVIAMPQQVLKTGQQPDRSSPLRWALLALLAEREDQGKAPLYGYKLGLVLERRFGPGWKITSSMVYSLLERLVRDDLVATWDGALPDDGGLQKVYGITAKGREALAEWQSSAASMELLSVDKLHAKIAASRVEDMPQTLDELADHERICLDMLDRLADADVALSSWRGVLMNVTRAAAVERLQGELRWNMRAREWIDSFAAQTGQSDELA